MASLALNKIIYEVRSSQLNFSLQETPFSLSISLRKTPIHYHRPAQVQQVQLDAGLDVLSESEKELEIENAFLKSEIHKVQKENSSLKVDLEQMKADRNSSDQAKNDRQTRINKISKTLDERNSEITLLLKSTEKLNEEKEGFKDELAKVTKIVKEKEKEIYSLESKFETLSSNLIQSKEDLNKLRKDISKERKVKNKAKTVDNFVEKNSNISSSIKSSNMPLHNCSSLATVSTSTNLSSLSTMPALAAPNSSKEESWNEKDILEEEVQFLKLSDQNQRAINIRLNNFMNRSRSRLWKKGMKLPKPLKWKSNSGRRNLEMKEGRKSNLRESLVKREEESPLAHHCPAPSSQPNRYRAQFLI
jgi:chromosome segregation ATPase